MIKFKILPWLLFAIFVQGVQAQTFYDTGARFFLGNQLQASPIERVEVNSTNQSRLNDLETLQQQNEDLKQHLNQLNEQLILLQQALVQSNQLYAESIRNSLNQPNESNGYHTLIKQHASQTTLFTAVKKIGAKVTNIILRHFPDDRNLALKVTAALFAIVMFLFVFAVWPSHRKRMKKEERKLYKEETMQAVRLQLQENFLKKIERRREKLKKHVTKQQQKQRRMELRNQRKIDKKLRHLQKDIAAAPSDTLMPLSETLTPEPTFVSAIYRNILQPTNNISQQLDLARYWLKQNNYTALKQALRPVFARGNKLQCEEARLLLEEAIMTSEEQEV